MFCDTLLFTFRSVVIQVNRFRQFPSFLDGWRRFVADRVSYLLHSLRCFFKTSIIVLFKIPVSVGFCFVDNLIFDICAIFIVLCISMHA